MQQISVLKKLDSLCGRSLSRLLPRPVSTAPAHIERILFIRPGGIGDAVLLVPALQAVKQQYPTAAIEVLAEKRNAAVLHLSDTVANVMRYDVPREFMAVFSRRYNVVVDSEQWHQLSAIVARLIRAPVKIGYGTNERSRLLTHVIDYQQDRYEVQSFFDLLQPLSVTPAADVLTAPFLSIPPPEVDDAAQRLGALNEREFVVVFPGASIPERRWGTERFHQLAVRLNEAGYPVVVVGGPEDADSGEAILAGVEGRNLAGQTSLPGSAAVIEKAALLVSGDSGILHMAVGLGRPTVSLFGPGIAVKWAPRGDQHVVLNRELPCSPCTQFGYTPACQYKSRCLTEIAVDDVYAAVMSLLAERHTR